MGGQMGTGNILAGDVLARWGQPARRGIASVFMCAFARGVGCGGVPSWRGSPSMRLTLSSRARNHVQLVAGHQIEHDEVVRPIDEVGRVQQPARRDQITSPTIATRTSVRAMSACSGGVDVASFFRFRSAEIDHASATVHS